MYFHCFIAVDVWLLLHAGVCNTDNFSLLSITIDYGPFGFMDDYDPGKKVELWLMTPLCTRIYKWSGSRKSARNWL